MAPQRPARVSGSTSPKGPVAGKQRQQGEKAASLAAPLAAGSQTLTFSEFAVGTVTTDAYKPQGVLFSSPTGDAPPFIATDASNPTSPVLSGSPLFNGNIVARFVVPDSTTPTRVSGVSLDVGYIDNAGSVQVLAFSPTGIEVLSADSVGIVHLSTTVPNVSTIEVVQSATEPAGFAIDNLSFTPGSAPARGLDGGAPKASESNGQNNPGENLSECGVRFNGDPVNTLTGNATETFRDVGVNGPGPGLNLDRTYNSERAADSGFFGHGWTSTWEASLVVNDEHATATFGSGATVDFTKTGLGWVAAPRVTAVLTDNPNGSRTLLVGRRTTMTFDSAGALTGLRDTNGHTITLARPDPSTVTATDDAGRVVALHLAGGHVTTVSDPADSVTSYDYSSDGDLIAVTDPLGHATKFGYDSSHRLISMTNPAGGTITNHYDDSSRVVSQVDAENRKTTFDYTSVPGTTRVIAADGLVTDCTYNGGVVTAVSIGVGTPLVATTHYEYDPATAGRIKDVGPDGTVTTRSFDANGNLLTVTDGLGRTLTYTYDGLDNPTSVTFPSGRVDTAEYDNDGNLTRTIRDAQGLALATTFQHDPTGSITSTTTPEGATSTYTYDPAGNLLTTLDPDGHAVTITRDGLGREITRTLEVDANQPGAEGSLTTTQTWDPLSRLISVTAPNGGHTTYSYDAAGRLTATTGPDGHSSVSTYDASGDITSSTAGDGSTTRFAYDAARRLIKRTDPGGGTTEYTYDSLGRQIGETDPLGRKTQSKYDIASRRTSRIASNGTTVNYTYDAAGQLLTMAYAGADTHDAAYSYTSDGLRRSMSDGTGTTSYEYDTAGRLTAVIDGTGKSVRYRLDKDDRAVGLTYPSGQEVSRTFSAAGSLTSVTDWLGNTTTMANNSFGQPSTVPYPNGMLGAWSYDQSGQPSQVTYGPAAGQPIASFTATSTTSGLVSRLGASGAITQDVPLTYSKRDQLASAEGRPVEYDPSSNLLLRPDGAQQRFDAAGQLQSSTAPTIGALAPATGPGRRGDAAAVKIRQVLSRHARAGMDSLVLKPKTLPAGSRVTVLITSGAAQPGATVGESTVTGAGLEWQRLSHSGQVGGSVEIWTAKVGREQRKPQITIALGAGHGTIAVTELTLTGVDRISTRESSGADSAPVVAADAPAGSMLLAAGTATATKPIPAHPARGSRILTVAKDSGVGWTGVTMKRGPLRTAGPAQLGLKSRTARWSMALVIVSPTTVGGQPLTYAYTDAGERSDVVTSGTTLQHYSYDAESRLKTVAAGGVTVASYGYDGDGLRKSKVTPTGAAAYTYDQQASLPLLLDDGATSYVYGPGGVAIEQIKNGKATFLLPDTQGSIRLLADGTGATIGSATYGVTGVTVSQSGEKSALGFDGQYTDAETGFQYLRARYYDPTTAAFLTPDPLKGLTASTYGFAGGNPVSFADPSGLFFISCAALLTDGGDLLGGAGDLSEGIGRRASVLGHILRSSSDAEARSYAARLLRGAGELARNPVVDTLKKASRVLPVVSGVLTTVADLSENKPLGESIGAGVGAAAGSVAGASIASAFCGVETAATFGVGSLACPALVLGGGLVGGKVGEFVGGRVGGWIGKLF